MTANMTVIRNGRKHLDPFYAPIKRKQLSPGRWIEEKSDIAQWRHLYTADEADTKQTHAETETQTTNDD